MAVPGSPPSLTVLTADGRLTATWGASTNVPTNYQIYYGTSASGPWTLFETNPATDRNSAIQPLTNGVEFWVQVTASNADGVSAPSTVGPRVPNPRPEVPRNVSAYAVGATELEVNWLADPVATRYLVRWRLTGTSTYSPILYVEGTSCRITGLTSGSDYDISVSANNTTGTSSANIIGPISPVAVPANPSGFTVTVLDSDTVTLAWSQGANVLGFDVLVSTSAPPAVPVMFPPAIDNDV